MSSLLMFVAALIIPFTFSPNDQPDGKWVGTYQSEDGQTAEVALTIYKNGNFQIDYGNDGEVERTGVSDHSNGLIYFSDTGGKSACNATGIYKLKASPNSLELKKQKDPCNRFGSLAKAVLNKSK